ncbi:WPP domain-associated protein [Humulus lupulus]|uniref:WPP domain-associated protein n=1 Tax=Humulus lupulus TaxID=3486 RepID=UPI002B412E37|nr:WPP domain-associated protein [Humulus lupulus]
MILFTEQMEEFFGGVEGRFRGSITDSTMMRIVHRAMNKAHKRVKSKEGVIERLNEISKFYELAVMQLEGCMKFVQEEPDIFVLESSSEEDVLAGLAEIRNRLKGRLSESEMAIREKDRELTERLDSELKLRQALEIKEKELVSLRAKLKLEKTKSEGVDDREGEFCELKNSVDQQVWNIRQKLEPGQCNKLDESIDNEKVEQMGSDIDMLKETLDLAFGKMRNAIILSEVPIEQQWRWGIEKDTVFILLKGLMQDFQEMSDMILLRQDNELPTGLRFGGDLWSVMLREVARLRNELESFLVQHGKPSKSSIFENFNRFESENFREATEEDGNHYVAKMIKNHESIIREKSAEAEELNLLKRELMKEKAYSSCKKDKEPVTLNKRVQEIIEKLENFIEWSANMGESFDDHRDLNGEESLSRKGFLNFNANDNDELPNEMGRRELELEELSLKTNIMEETYITLFEGLLKEFNTRIYIYDYESLIWKGQCKDLVAEMTNHWNVKIESNNVESQIREETHCIVFNEAIKDCISSINLKLAEFNNARSENICLEESAFTEKLDHDIQILMFREMLKEWNKIIECYESEIIVREEIYDIVFDKTTKSISDTVSSAFHKLEWVNLAESSIKEDVCMDFIRETIKQWRMELDTHNTQSLLREEIHQFVILEAVKDAFVLSKQVDFGNEDKLSRCIFCEDKLRKSKQLTSQESISRKVDLLLDCLEVEENLVLSLHYEIREKNTNIGLLGLESESFGRKNKSSSVNRKLENTLHQLAKSKETLGKMVSSLSLITVSLESSNYLQDKESSIDEQQEEDSKEQLDPFEKSAVLPILGFIQDMMEEFEDRVREKLEVNILRLEQIHHHLDPLVDTVSSVREKESLYKKAFTRRCQNLHKAETEVDLLGDQVDMLLGLLHKIYKTLNHYSPVLQHYSEVLELMQLIKKEIYGVIHAPKH